VAFGLVLAAGGGALVLAGGTHESVFRVAGILIVVGLVLAGVGALGG